MDRLSAMPKAILDDILARVIEHLFSHCPLIEQLSVEHCYVYDHLSIEDPLESLFLHRGIQQVHIDSPNLKNLCYEPLDFDAPLKLNFDSCTTLRSLQLMNLQSTAIVDKWFVELFSKHPFLESLKIYECCVSERINISSTQLKVLVLSYCSFSEVIVDAPNLLALYCDSSHFKSFISFVRSSNLLEVKVLTAVDFEYFYSLREFIWNIPQKILASLSLFINRSFHEYGYPYLPELQVSSIPPRIKHLEMRVDPDSNNEALFGPLMNYLLSSCFPKTISFIYGGCYKFIEFFYDMVMGSKKGECHCSSSDTKCWWHALKIVNISCSFMTNQNIDF
ncbi:hypothetical protein PIB30_105234 [Stylosanthes scabra]|uniref:F-box/LRR-repeat protein 15/At3g58940/PEG3-like LRR domain-containing protein n=1 Tax=Stylosanthes scabra TaxID=79078 RepID=A0ABU6QZ96_9FABA|nr:hypothetical protein [Stylosanthes scabra]